MKNRYFIKEADILSCIDGVLRENRKVIKVPGGNDGQKMPQTPMDMSIPQDAMAPQGDAQSMGMQDATQNAGGGFQDNAQLGDNGGMENEFDNDFDAGVEADEDADPQKYIQQLTGKLSQKLNSYNSENESDNGLNKYVAKMIIAATCKNLDDKAKSELIKKIKSSNSEMDDMENVDDSGEEMGDENFDENGGDEMENLSECVYSKRNLNKLIKKECIGITRKNRSDNMEINQKPIKGPWASKF